MILRKSPCLVSWNDLFRIEKGSGQVSQELVFFDSYIQDRFQILFLDFSSGPLIPFTYVNHLVSLTLV